MENHPAWTGRVTIMRKERNLSMEKSLTDKGKRRSLIPSMSAFLNLFGLIKSLLSKDFRVCGVHPNISSVSKRVNSGFDVSKSVLIPNSSNVCSIVLFVLKNYKFICFIIIHRWFFI